MSTQNAKTDWGYYVVQTQPRRCAFGLTYEIGFEQNPPNSGFGLQLPLDAPILITGMHGNLAVTAWGPELSAPNPANASIVAVVYANNPDGDVPILWHKVVQLGKGSFNLPITATFQSPIRADSLSLGWFVDQPGAQTVSLGLVMACVPSKAGSKV